MQPRADFRFKAISNCPKAAVEIRIALAERQFQGERNLTLISVDSSTGATEAQQTPSLKQSISIRTTFGFPSSLHRLAVEHGKQIYLQPWKIVQP